MIRRKLRIGIDIDDTLLDYRLALVELANLELHPEQEFTTKEWTTLELPDRMKVCTPYLDNSRVVDIQRPMKGSIEFVEKLLTFAEVYFVTAIVPELMTQRAEQLKRYFPGVDRHHYIFTARKDMVDLDFLIDDGAHNILKLTTAFPVLFRNEWNNHVTGVYTINEYEEFFWLLEQFQNILIKPATRLNKGGLYLLVGPSGSGKTAVVKELEKLGNYQEVRSITTRERRPDDAKDAYIFDNKEHFEELIENGEIIEYTNYAGNYYGTSKSAIQDIIDSGKNAVVVVDITGAIKLKHMFENACICYIDRKREDILKAVIDRKVSTEEKVKRIVSLETEKKNKIVADYCINNNGDIKTAVDEIVLIEKE